MRTFGNLALVLALAPGLTCLGQAAGGVALQQAQSPEFLVPPKGFTGMVRDPDGKPAAGVAVSFRPIHTDALEPIETKSDQNGRYLILLQGKANNRGRRLNQPPSAAGVVVARDLERNLAGVRASSELPSNLDLTLEPGLIFSGVVWDVDGLPVTNAAVELCFTEKVKDGLAAVYAGVIFGTSNLDEHGLFVFTAVPPDRSGCSVTASAKGYGIASAALMASQVMATEGTTNRIGFGPLVLKRADRRVAGRVLGTDGTPVANAEVAMWGDGQPGRWQTTSDKDGHFVFEPVCEGPITVDALGRLMEGRAECRGGDTNVEVKLDPDRLHARDVP